MSGCCRRGAKGVVQVDPRERRIAGMDSHDRDGVPEAMKQTYPGKFVSEEKAFSHIRRGDRIFVGSGCGEPQYLVDAMIRYAGTHPKALFDAEVLQVWTLGVAPYADEKFKSHFRYNTFFIGDHTREAVNRGLADYTPIFLSQVPGLLRRKLVSLDVALIQTSPPDRNGYMSLGVSVDITKAAAEHARTVIVQTNRNMPAVHGDTFLHIEEVDFILPRDEPILEYVEPISSEVSDRIGNYVARLIEDGDTLQVGYGSLPNAILSNLRSKRHLGVHTELLTDGVVALMKAGAVDNKRKSLHRGKTVASFCMGRQETYEYLRDNPAFEFMPIDYTNDPLIIARNSNMTAINAALEIDLTGQATAESIGGEFYSGIGGQADFMRGAVLSPTGKSILALRSTARNGEISRIVPMLGPGAGMTLNRGDVHYVVTEYGIAYLHGKSIRERAMDLIAIAHPKFRPWLIEEAKKGGMIYRDQAYVPGEKGEYPEALETHRTTKNGEGILLRPAKISDEPLFKDFFYSLSEQSLYRRFVSVRQDMPHERLQDFVVVDYTKRMALLALIEGKGREEMVGLGEFALLPHGHVAEIALVVRDDYQGRGIGTELLAYLAFLARKQGLMGFTAEVLVDNKPVLHLLEKMGFDIEKRKEAGVYEMKIAFREAA